MGVTTSVAGRGDVALSVPAYRGLFMLCLVGVPLFVWVLVPWSVFSACRGRSNTTSCANNLRMLGLSAIQYADDKRFYPHVNRIRELDGDYDSNHTPKTLRTLLYYGYHDNPEGWICPSSYDMAHPVDRELWEQPRGWFWGGRRVADRGSPLHDDYADPALSVTDEVSYGWTRKGINTGVRSTHVLAADRALRGPDSDDPDRFPGEIGNHPNGANLLFADATVQWQHRGPDAYPTVELVSRHAPSFTGLPPPEPYRLPEWVGVAAPVTTWLVLLAWFRHRGWPRTGKIPVRLKRRRRWHTVEVLGFRRRTLRPDFGAHRPAPPGGPRLGVTLSPGQRCPYCHDALSEGCDLVTCEGCATLTHRDCAQEGRGACATFGCRNSRR